MDERSKVFSELAEEILEHGAYKATKYLSDRFTIKATRKRYTTKDGKKYYKGKTEILFTLGAPNYEERAKIKQAKKNGTGPIEMTAKYPPKGKK